MANRMTEKRGRTSKRKQATKGEVQEELSKQDTYYHLLQVKAERDTAAISTNFSPQMEMASYAGQPVSIVNLNQKTCSLTRAHYSATWMKNTFPTWNASGTLA